MAHVYILKETSNRNTAENLHFLDLVYLFEVHFLNIHCASSNNGMIPFIYVLHFFQEDLDAYDSDDDDDAEQGEDGTAPPAAESQPAPPTEPGTCPPPELAHPAAAGISGNVGWGNPNLSRSRTHFLYWLLYSSFLIVMFVCWFESLRIFQHPYRRGPYQCDAGSG